ncbi:conserved hypothetical protein [Gloeothece citriformis PCC 7424]|uniref:Uncharacterized protein n=1 Tax=Gloeothece citriformis (strain PCC 7424) TaxID=65393 RepID=B7KGM9_GLOC7|nr:hypothetical protein [Gloeothece citriformis]ACK71956.1 conserved hypothetical protein [Gloeothece citriformis PCC 7424]
MTRSPDIEISFAVNDPNLDEDEQAKITTQLLRELRELDEVEKVDRTEDINPELGSKPGFATLIGWLSVTVNPKNLKGLLGFLGDRLKDKPITITVKVGDQEAKLEAKSRQELQEAEKIALNLIEAFKDKS